MNKFKGRGYFYILINLRVFKGIFFLIENIMRFAIAFLGTTTYNLIFCFGQLATTIE